MEPRYLFALARFSDPGVGAAVVVAVAVVPYDWWSPGIGDGGVGVDWRGEGWEELVVAIGCLRLRHGAYFRPSET